MELHYLSIANSSTTFLICLVAVVVVTIPSLLFLRLSLREAKNLNISNETIKKTITNSAIFSVVPSLPILITLAVLMPLLGKYIPWIRLSVIGSAMYETMAADTTIKSFGLTGLGDPNLTSSMFISLLWVMSLSILTGPVLNIFALKSYDKKLKTMRTSGGFLSVATGALFIGVMAVMGIPIVFNFSNPTGIVVIFTSGVSVVLLDKLAKKTGKKVIGEFSFPVAMIIGMASAVVVNGIFI